MEELYLFFKHEDSPYETKVELKKLLDPPLNNNSILMDYAPIQENKIYLCLAEDLINKNELMTNNFFPYLYEKNITQLDELTDQRPKLMEANKSVFNDRTTELFQSVDLFYDIAAKPENPLTYVNKGIKSLSVVIKPEFDVKIPLDIVFKIIHATEENPLIKYNPSTRQEKIYRLYADKTATNGHKIPFLKKTDIYKYMKSVAKTKSVAIILGDQSVVCEFDEHGFITISADFLAALQTDGIDSLFKRLVNPIIQQVKSFFEMSGYKFRLFTSLKEVEIVYMTYEANIEIKRQFRLDELKGCLSSVFINESGDYRDGIHLRYKRVSNFNKVTSQQAYVSEQIDMKMSADEIVNGLLENYPDDLSREAATELVRGVINDIQLAKGVKRSSIGKSNPGFKTTIQLNPVLGSITVFVEHINNIGYLSVLPVYIDAMVRMTQFKEFSDLCVAKEEMLDIVFQEPTLMNKERKVDDFSMFSEDDLESDNEGEHELDEEPEDDDKDLDLEGGGSDSESSVESYKASAESDAESSVYKPKSEKSVKENDDSDSEYSIESFDMELESESENVESSSEEEEEEKKQEIPDSLISEAKSQVKNEVKEQLEKPKKKQLIVESDSSDSESDDDAFAKLDGMKLNKPYLFQKRIERKDPILILKRDTQEFNSYSRTCKSDTKSQPVILTDQELEKINKEHPGFLRDEDVIKYGSKMNKDGTPNEEKEFNYICPRYWCLKTNTIIDPVDMKPGKDGLEHKPKTGESCGKVIPDNATKVTPGHYVYEFKKPGEGYKQRFPGFKPDKHPNKKVCLPCCFDKPSAGDKKTKGRVDAYNKCKNNQVSEKEDKSKYTIGADKFPIPNGRWGFLPPQIQILLKTACKANADNCLLRFGVENNKKQSFIAAMAAYKGVSYKEMKSLFIKAVNADNFPTFQNGNLIAKFSEKSDMNHALSQFKLFLKNEDSMIDHTFLWDICCFKNPYLFVGGINLVIFHLPYDDPTNNVQLICPSNHYSVQFYDPVKPTALLVKQGDYYEPLFIRNELRNEKKEAKSELKKLFMESELPVLREMVAPFFKTICKPHDSIFVAKKPLLLGEMIPLLTKGGYKLIKQVINPHHQVIGVIASYKEKRGFVPCYPSRSVATEEKDLKTAEMNDLSNWTSYKEVVSFLSTLKKRIPIFPCKLAFKVVEDELIVGILTETNQFIQVNPPSPPVDDDIPMLKDDNYILNTKSPSLKQADYVIETSEKIDEERADYILRIKSETKFYNIFRNSVRVVINDPENAGIKTQIEKELLNKFSLYSFKLKTVSSLLRELMRSKIEFTGGDTYYVEVNKLATCIGCEKEERGSDSICAISGDCSPILPKHNLLAFKRGKIKENEPMYYSKMADELIRYSRIKSFMLNPANYLAFGSLNYNLRDDEIIMLHSLLTNEYFDSLVPANLNQFIKNNTHDDAAPQITQFYDNVVSLGCKASTVERTNTSNPLLPKRYLEHTYNEKCSYQILIDIVKERKLTTQQIKNDLFSAYKPFLEKHYDKIMDILSNERGLDFGSLEDYMFQDMHYLTEMDIWLMATFYKIPSFLITDGTLKMLYGTKDDKFQFIKMDSRQWIEPIDFSLNESMLKAINSFVDVNDYLVGLQGAAKQGIVESVQEIDE
jgi:hypothetical protein